MEKWLSWEAAIRIRRVGSILRYVADFPSQATFLATLSDHECTLTFRMNRTHTTTHTGNQRDGRLDPDRRRMATSLAQEPEHALVRKSRPTRWNLARKERRRDRGYRQGGLGGLGTALAVQYRFCSATPCPPCLPRWSCTSEHRLCYPPPPIHTHTRLLFTNLHHFLYLQYRYTLSIPNSPTPNPPEAAMRCAHASMRPCVQPNPTRPRQDKTRPSVLPLIPHSSFLISHSSFLGLPHPSSSLSSLFFLPSFLFPGSRVRRTCTGANSQ